MLDVRSVEKPSLIKIRYDKLRHTFKHTHKIGERDEVFYHAKEIIFIFH